MERLYLRDPIKIPPKTSNPYYERAMAQSNLNPYVIARREIRNINDQLHELLEDNPGDLATAKWLLQDRERAFAKYERLREDPELTQPTLQDFQPPEVIDLVSSDEEVVPMANGEVVDLVSEEEEVAPTFSGPSAKDYKNKFKFKGYRGEDEAETGGTRRRRRRGSSGRGRGRGRSRTMRGGRRRGRRSRRH